MANAPDSANEASPAGTPKIEPEQTASGGAPGTGLSLIGSAADTPAGETEARSVTAGALVLAAKSPDFSSRGPFASNDPEPDVTEATVINSSRWRMPAYGPLAAGIVFAVA